jgi:hypothetical protein
MLNRAMEIMREKEAMINEARQVLVVLGAESAPATSIVQNNIVINKGKVVAVEVPVVKEVEVTNDAYIEQLLNENIKLENEITFRDGQIIGYQRQIKELEDKVAELQAALNAKKLTRKERAAQILNDEAVNDTYEKVFNETPEEIVVEEQPVQSTSTVEVYSVDKGYVHGQVTIDEKQYYFTASNRFDKVVVYGTMDEDIVTKAKYAIIKHYGNSSVFLGYRGTEDEVLYAEDKENNIVAYCDKGIYYGFAGSYYFVWNPAYALPVGCLTKNMYSKKRVLRKFNASWGKLFAKRGEDIMALCDQLHYVDHKREELEAEMGVYKPSVNTQASNEVIVNVSAVEDDDVDSLDI